MNEILTGDCSAPAGRAAARERRPAFADPLRQHRLRIRRLRRSAIPRRTWSGRSAGCGRSARRLPEAHRLVLRGHRRRVRRRDEVTTRWVGPDAAQLDRLALHVCVACMRVPPQSRLHFLLRRRPELLTFNAADTVRVPPARRTTYADRRHNPAGKPPDYLGAATAGRRAILPGSLGYLAPAARLRHLSREDRPSVPDAGSGAGTDRPRGEQSGRCGAGSVRGVGNDVGRGSAVGATLARRGVVGPITPEPRPSAVWPRDPGSRRAGSVVPPGAETLHATIPSGELTIRPAVHPAFHTVPSATLR